MKGVRLGSLGLGALVPVGAALIAIAPRGWGGESQFNPETLECRGVSYYYVPYTSVRAWYRSGEPHRPRLTQFWLDEGYARPGEPAGRWHTIVGGVGRWRRSSGAAKPFWYPAGCPSDEGAEEWIAWSRRHPRQAEDLWSRVVGLIRQAATCARPATCYAAAAELMISVREAEDATTYGERVAQWYAQWGGELERE